MFNAKMEANHLKNNQHAKLILFNKFDLLIFKHVFFFFFFILQNMQMVVYMSE
ncbi:hypothetical protein [Plasmodium yoelii yoelii]|uniref:Uncharacterized protein n=1 Tax=Plasmodium yoelii yoelii TaxID=73239 RepID=Q7RCD3_PLAYO|nr:hypothetical protein [Plasmodium yoelii yoelii]